MAAACALKRCGDSVSLSASFHRVQALTLRHPARLRCRLSLSDRPPPSAPLSDQSRPLGCANLQAFKRGETLCPIRNTLPGIKAYSSVQVLPDPPIASAPNSPDERRHIELNSDLLYVNHSCDPNVVFDVNGEEAQPTEEDATGKWEGRWRVRAEKDIAAGEVSSWAALFSRTLSRQALDTMRYASSTWN